MKLIEEVKADPNNLLILPYKKYVLDNGLTVIIHEDHSDPVVYVDVTYHVGSSREMVGRSGFAHFFEHMMFQGSKNVADEQHIKTISEAGGSMNGTTNNDRTNYFEVVPNNQIEKVLWLEADRMGFLLDSVTQKKFEIQRATVKNERGQRMDNQPYGLIPEKIGQALYPFGHPYSWHTIGYIEDLNAATLDDLKRFFLRWYGPNNALLTIAGDVDIEKTLSMISKYFGSIKRGPEVKNQEKQVPKLDTDRYISYEDKIQFPALMLTYPTVPIGHPDEPALDALAEVLGKPKTSLLYKNFVNTQKAIQAYASHECSELAGQFNLLIIAYQGNTLADIEKRLYATLEEFQKTGVNDDDLIQFKAGFESNLINSMSSVSSKGKGIAYGQTFFNKPNYSAEELEKYKNIKKEDVIKAYNKYIKGKPTVHLSVYPVGQASIVAKKDNFTPKIKDPNYTPDLSEYKSLAYQEPKDNFDRSIQPPAGDNPKLKLPELKFGNMKNNIRYAYTKWNETPTVDISIYVSLARRNESPENAGITNLMTSMMKEGTKNYSTEEMDIALSKLGSIISIRSGNEEMRIYVSSLKKNIKETLTLLEETLFLPAFQEKDFTKVKTQHIGLIQHHQKQPGNIAADAYQSVLYKGDDIMTVSSLGSEQSVSKITLEQVKKYYETYFSLAGARVAIVSNIEEKEIIPLLSFLETTTTGKLPAPPRQVKPQYPKKTTIYFVDKPGAPQSEIRIGFLGMKFDALGDYYKCSLMNFPLGGSFNSRINLNLREEKGYTYGAFTYFSGSRYIGPFTARAAVKANVTKESIEEFLKEIQGYVAQGITDEELSFMKSRIGQSKALEYEAPNQKSELMNTILKYNLKLDYLNKQDAIVKSIDKKTINKLAKKYLDINKMAIIVVGDKAKYFEAVASLGYETIELKRGQDGVFK